MNNKLAIAFLTAAPFLHATETVAAMVRGTVEKVDATARTIAIKSADGAEITVKFAESTAAHGFEGGKNGWQGAKKGAEVAAHGTRKGAVFIATEVDHLGRGGLQVAKVTVTEIDKAGRFVVVKTEAGVIETYHLLSKAAQFTAKEFAAGMQATVYCTEESGKKVAHFFSRV